MNSEQENMEPVQGRWEPLAVLSFLLVLSPLFVALLMSLLQDYVSSELAASLSSEAGMLVVVLFVLGTPVAIIMALLALGRIRKAEGVVLKGRGFAIVAIVLSCILWALAFLSAPTFFRAREHARESACKCVLSCIAAAKSQIALEEKLTNGAEILPEKVISGIKGGTKNLICPAAGRNTYTFGKVGESPRCSVHTNLQTELGL